jgi:hypothetical protein
LTTGAIDENVRDVWNPQSRRISRYAWKALAGSAMDEFDLPILGFMHFINSVCQRAQPSICIVVSCGDNIYSCNAECLFRRYCDPFAPSSLVHYGEVNRVTDLSKIIDESFIRYVATRDRRRHTRLNGRATRHNVLDLLYLKRRGLSLRFRRTEGSEPQLRRAGREEV